MAKGTRSFSGYYYIRYIANISLLISPFTQIKNGDLNFKMNLIQQHYQLTGFYLFSENRSLLRVSNYIFTC